MFKIQRTAIAGFAIFGAAQAADLPKRQAAPTEYVKVCDAYGSGFFYIPGTQTCIRVGGAVVAQMGAQGASNGYSMAMPPAGAPVGLVPSVYNTAPYGFTRSGKSLAYTQAPQYGVMPAAGAYRPTIGNGRDAERYNAQARIELDTRTQTDFGTLRTFMRLNASYGSGANATSGSLTAALGSAGVYNVSANPASASEIVYIDKAFIQFAGLTAGRVQSFFDFYTDNYNYEILRGSNQDTWALAYTYAIGGGFSATISAEDTYSHRSLVSNVTNAAALNLTNAQVAGPLGLVGFAGPAVTPAAARIPDFTGNLRIDQPWGAAQLAGAIHPVRAAMYSATATGPGAADLSYAESINNSNSIGYAISGGVNFNLDAIGQGDKLWLQAIYAYGAIGYVSGNNVGSFNGGGLNGSINYGVGQQRINNGYGWNGGIADADCVYDYTGACTKSKAYAFTAAFKHYWLPTLSSALFGSYYAVKYSQNALNPVSPYNTTVASVGMTNYEEIRVGTNLIWTPVKNFDIGGEMMWVHGNTSRPNGLASDSALRAAGLPAFKSQTDAYYGKVRLTRSF